MLRFPPRTQRSLTCNTDFAVAVVAGVAAEAMFTGRKINDRLRKTSGRCDYGTVALIAGRISFRSKRDSHTGQSRSEKSLIDEWEARASAMLHVNWAWVESVSGLFIAKGGRVSGGDVRNCRPQQQHNENNYRRTSGLIETHPRPGTMPSLAVPSAPGATPQPAPSIDLFLTPTEAAKIATVHPGTLLRWAREGKVPHRRLSPRKIVFPLSTLNAWLTSGYTEAAVRAA